MNRILTLVKKSAFFSFFIFSFTLLFSYQGHTDSSLSKEITTETGTMILIPAGKFIMGSNTRHADEGPQYVTSLDDYYIDKYELSNAMYKKYIDAAKKRSPFHWKKGKIPAGKENHPVVYVNWFEARNFCKWAGKHLPSQKEWEKAGRGTDGRTYPWGNDFDPQKTNNPQTGSQDTTPIDSYPEGKSPFGLYNMSGNVWEWTNDWYNAYPNSTEVNSSYGEKNKVLKGGSWYDCVTYGCGISAPMFNRSYFIPKIRNNSFGFRCAKNIN